MRVLFILMLLATAPLFVACGNDDGNGSTGSSTPDAGDTEELVELELAAENTQFDRDRLQAPAASEVSLTLNNKDSVEHNFSLYGTESPNEPLFEGSLFAGPSFLVYQFTAPEDPGTYRFQCDVHPDAMKGEFIVE